MQERLCSPPLWVRERNYSVDRDRSLKCGCIFGTTLPLKTLKEISMSTKAERISFVLRRADITREVNLHFDLQRSFARPLRVASL